MNLYGWSKHLFDQALIARRLRGEKLPPQWAGLKFFNVFGPNEYHKGKMASVLARIYRRGESGPNRQAVQVAQGRYRRRRPAPGLHLCRRCGRGGALAAGQPSHIRIVQCRHRRGAQLPRDDRGDVRSPTASAANRIYRHAANPSAGQYQYFTQSEVGRLRAAGYNAGFTPLEEAVGRYVTQYLDREDRYR